MSEENEVVEDQSQVEQEEVKTPEPTDQDRNWKAAGEALRLQKQRIEELEAKLAYQTPVKQEEPDELDKLDDDDYVTAGKAKTLRESAKKIATKEARQIVQEYMQKQQILQDEERMRTKHEDFDFVIENFAIPMIKNDPALAHKIQNSKNPAETAYKLAKISDEYEETTVKKQMSPKAEKILKNSARPTSSNAVGSPLKNQSDDFSKLNPQQVWEMSQKYARQA